VVNSREIPLNIILFYAATLQNDQAFADGCVLLALCAPVCEAEGMFSSASFTSQAGHMLPK
jgi:hypothetical protein